MVGDGQNGGSGARFNHETYVAELCKLQADALLLVRFIAGRKDLTVNPKDIHALPGLVGQQANEFLSILSSVLRMPAEEIADDHEKAGFLFASVDYLTYLAKPATVDTIRLTRAYTEPKSMHSKADQGKGIRAAARTIRWMFLCIGLFALMVLILSGVLMAHVVSGQSSVTALKELRVELSAHQAKLGVAYQSLPLPTVKGVAAYVKGLAFPDREAAIQRSPADFDYCRKDKDGDYVFVKTAQQHSICDEWNDLYTRMSIVYAQLGQWNRETEGMFVYKLFSAFSGPGPVFPGECDSLQDCARISSGGIKREQWERTEYRTELMLIALSTYIIPLILGFVGSAAYALRNLNERIDNFTLEPRDAYQGALRLVLGLILGGLVGLMLDSHGLEVHGNKISVEFSGYKISLWAAAFLVGYAVQVVFQALDRIIEALLKAMAPKDVSAGIEGRRPPTPPGGDRPAETPKPDVATGT